MSTSFLADTPLGRFINSISQGKLLPKPDQSSDFVLPDSISKRTRSEHQQQRKQTLSSGSNDTLVDQQQSPKNSADVEANRTASLQASPSIQSVIANSETVTRLGSRNIAAATPPPVDPLNAVNEKQIEETADVIIIDWYHEDDAENPYNWSLYRKCLTTFCICFLTFSVYAGSSIITPSIPGLMQEFNVGSTKGTLTLSVFIMGYAVGPLLLAPPSDVPSIGRSTPYWTSMLALICFNIGAAKAQSYGTLIAMRLLAGMAGSPALATGGASLGDMWQGLTLPKAIALWAMGAVCGPVLAPIIAGWSAQIIDWRLPLYLFVALSGLGFIVVFAIMPETLHSNILYRRAQRLRNLTRDHRIMSQGEIDQTKLSRSHFFVEGLYKPIRISFDPIVLYSSVLLGLVYAIFYCAFEAVPLIYGDIYHFNLGEQSLPFLALGVFAIVAMIGYLCYLKYYFDPRFISKAQRGIIDPEDRIILALISAPLVLVSLLWTGWTARINISYWSPLIAQGLYVIPTYYLFQSVLTYLAFAYPQDQASVFTANDLIRSLIASAFPLFARAIFVNLGLGKGYTLLAGLSLALMLPMFGLYKYGHILRRHSQFAHEYSTPSASSSPSL